MKTTEPQQQLLTRRRRLRLAHTVLHFFSLSSSRCCPSPKTCAGFLTSRGVAALSLNCLLQCRPAVATPQQACRPRPRTPPHRLWRGRLPLSLIAPLTRRLLSCPLSSHRRRRLRLCLAAVTQQSGQGVETGLSSTPGPPVSPSLRRGRAGFTGCWSAAARTSRSSPCRRSCPRAGRRRGGVPAPLHHRWGTSAGDDSALIRNTSVNLNRSQQNAAQRL